MLDLLYTLSLVVPLPFWALMILFPRQRLAQQAMESYLGVLLLGGMYVLTLFGAVLSGIGRIPLDFGSPNSLAAIFADPAMALVVWIHIVALDLTAGYWIYTDGLRRNKSTRLILVLTLFVAPLGLFIYFMSRLLERAAESAVRAAAESSLIAQ
ncbi:MAG: ABA4-like family protein [Aggregatilineales bacterium]